MDFDGKEGFRPTLFSSWVSLASREVKEAMAGAIYAEWDQYCAARSWRDEQGRKNRENPPFQKNFNTCLHM